MLRLTIIGALTVSLAAAGAGCGQNAGPPPKVERKGDKPAPPSAPSSPPNARPTQQKAKNGVAAATPEQALRTFLIAMLTKDEATLRAVTLPTEDFDWLLRGEVAPADQVDKIKAEMARVPIRALQPGDELTLPSGRRLTVQPKAVAADKAMLLVEGEPLPHTVRKVDGQWRVDAGPLIKSRKSYDAALKKKKPK